VFAQERLAHDIPQFFKGTIPSDEITETKRSIRRAGVGCHEDVCGADCNGLLAPGFGRHDAFSIPEVMRVGQPTVEPGNAGPVAEEFFP